MPRLILDKFSTNLRFNRANCIKRLIYLCITFHPAILVLLELKIV